jgi:hypothetical protein
LIFPLKVNPTLKENLHELCIEIYTQVNNLESLGGLPVGKSEKKIKNEPQMLQKLQMLRKRMSGWAFDRLPDNN